MINALQLDRLLTDALTTRLPRLTPRDVLVPTLARKALAVVGVRRAGKTSFLWQSLVERAEAGRPRESLVLLPLEDDRLDGIDAESLDWVVEEYFRRYPEFRWERLVTFCLDEVQVVAGWERFVRRLIDTEHVEVLLCGSSAKLLSREVATALRGRGMEVLVHPFSFREALRHSGTEPEQPWVTLERAQRSKLDQQLRDYLQVGGFPEAQGIEARNRAQLLRGYVDVVVLRDVIDRHAVSNPVALRWLQRQLLSTPAGGFTIQKLFNVLKSQGVAVGKDTLHEYLDYLEDSFLIRTVSMHSASERQRMVNPRKVYPVDPGLIAVFERTGRPQTGHALETAVLIELERRGYEVEYVRTSEGWEVDFLASAPAEAPLLVQVCASSAEAKTLEREIRALASAHDALPEARALLITADAQPPVIELPPSVEWVPASQWLLEHM